MNWRDDTAWYRNEKGELVCNTCKSEVFGGYCDCVPDDELQAKETEGE